jgi:hypothetical protein
MRIRELLEGSKFKDDEFVKQLDDSGKREINYDLPEDLIFFMDNDDDAHRTQIDEVVDSIMKKIKKDEETRPEMLIKPVKECYKLYKEQYPIRELPDEMDKKVLKDTCVKYHDLILQRIDDGKL